MLRTLLDSAREKASRVDWESLAPLCAAKGCRRRTRWDGILRRSAGVRFEGGWFCGPECLQQGLETRLAELLHRNRISSGFSQHRLPLGLLLLSRGVLEAEQLNWALSVHRGSGERFGTCLQKMGLASERQITSALAAQWRCPIYAGNPVPSCERLIPRLLQETHRMVPLQWVELSRCLFVGFEQKVEYTLLFAIEQMLDCHTEPCIVHESEFNRMLRGSFSRDDEEVRFASARTANEMAMSIASYAQQAGAERVRVTDCPEHIWVRFGRDQSNLDLVFRKSV